MPPARAAVEIDALPGRKPGAPVWVEVSMIAHKQIQAKRHSNKRACRLLVRNRPACPL